MGQNSIAKLVALGAALLAAHTHGQVTKIGPDAKICQLLPIAALEAHFGAKVSRVHGADTGTISQCSADVPDLAHAATVSTKPGPPIMTVEQRLKTYEDVQKLGGLKVTQVKNFGSVVCYTPVVLGFPQDLRVATCFLEAGGNLTLGVQSLDSRHANYEAVKALLEAAAARRK